MSRRSLRSLGLAVAVACAAAAPLLTNCAAPLGADDDLSEDAVTGVNNALGLRLTYDDETGRVNATLKDSLRPGEHLRIRVRRGAPTLTSERDLRCEDIDVAKPITGEGARDPGAIGRVVYRGPKVERSMLELLHVYDDHRWQSDPAWAAERLSEIQAAGGPKVLVEACIMRGDKVRAKLQTALEYAWDQGEEDARDLRQSSAGGLHFLSGDAGAGDGGGESDAGAGESDGGGGVTPRDEALHSMEEYGAKCVADLGEIPFFKKLGPGKYDTFDCRDFVGTGEGHEPVAIEGVEGALIPLTQDERPVQKCDGEGPNGEKSYSSYDCVDKCDHAEFLSEGCEVGPTVTHAVNAQGTDWVLLCRKVSEGEEKGWLKTKTFDDIAMIGHNPKTGKTCFFQNQIGSGTDGEHVPHPADVEKSKTLWDSPKGYCFESCHGTDPFIHSPWIDGARRRDNTPVVPMMGYDPDYEISWLGSPYYVVNMDAQGWHIPKQLVSDEAGACQSCHRVGGDNWMREFANWSTGNVRGGGPISESDSYWRKITDSTKASFVKTHWMPMRLDGVTEETWADSKWAKAVDFINKCNANESDPACLWANVPRGSSNPQAPSP